MKTYIDDREQQYRRERGVKLLPNASIKRLESGDYLFCDNNKTVAFEYKTMSDFIQSVITNRVFKQTIRQVEKYDFSFLIIVGNSKDIIDSYANINRHVHFTRQRYEKALMKIRLHTQIIFADDFQEACKLMVRQCKICFTENTIRKTPKIYENPVTNFLAGIKGIDKQADKITKTLNINTLKQLTKITKKQLLTVDGIGQKKANNIIKAIGG